MTEESHFYDVVVIGGGMSGVCAAIASARGGARTALIQDRPVLGGMASSEMRMHICGADHHMQRPDARETGILEEILLENKHRNPEMNYPIFDSVLWGKVKYQRNLDLYLNTTITEVQMSAGQDGARKIEKVSGYQMTSEKKISFSGEYFIDSTGDGTIGLLSGAEYRSGRESRNEFHESLAPEMEDETTMGNSILFQAIDKGHPVKFIKPDWAYTFSEEQLKNRDHHEISSGYWWIELGGNGSDTIQDAEEIRDELLKTLYGVWDHIKNGGDHDADNYDLNWVGVLPGKRESRRFIGDYILKQDDIDAGRIFPDAVAYGGWPMDLHTAGGMTCKDDVPTVWNHVDRVYTIPYRCLYSVNVGNLFLAGRIISCSHVAFSSTRVMGTCSVVGQAAGTAAAMALSHHCTPRELQRFISDLQQRLIRDDCYIPGCQNEDPSDLVRRATAESSSFLAGCEPQNVLGGMARHSPGRSNCWTADITKDSNPTITIRFPGARNIGSIQILFDSNLSREITPSINKEVLDRQENHSPSELVKDFQINLIYEGRQVYAEKITDNYQRKFNIHCSKQIRCDAIQVIVFSTFGSKYATIFEIRAYSA